MTRLHAFNAIKAAAYFLILLSTLALARRGDMAEVLDSCGWGLLLIALEWETRRLEQVLARGSRERLAFLAFQASGYGLAVWAWALYAVDGEWVDFVNASLWFLLSVIFFYELQNPDSMIGSRWRVLRAAKWVIYTVLIGIVAYWASASEPLDTLDAVLWIACFFIIEQDIFRLAGASSARSRAQISQSA